MVFMFSICFKASPGQTIQNYVEYRNLATNGAHGFRIDFDVRPSDKSSAILLRSSMTTTQQLCHTSKQILRDFLGKDGVQTLKTYLVSAVSCPEVAG